MGPRIRRLPLSTRRLIMAISSRQCLIPLVWVVSPPRLRRSVLHSSNKMAAVSSRLQTLLPLGLYRTDNWATRVLQRPHQEEVNMPIPVQSRLVIIVCLELTLISRMYLDRPEPHFPFSLVDVKHLYHQHRHSTRRLAKAAVFDPRTLPNTTRLNPVLRNQSASRPCQNTSRSIYV